jgi:SAM-dependent methyltransferase
MSHQITECRGCLGRELRPVLSLGQTPLANRLLTAETLEQPEPRYPLDLVFCPQCSLVQITETVPPEELFRDYVYFSSFSDTMVRHAESLANEVSRQYALSSSSLVMEIASNDGYLLQHYLRRGIPVLGIEPAQNVAHVARTERGIETINEFFGRDLAAQLSAADRRADVIHSHNVLAHVADLQGFVAGVAQVLQPGGVWINESPYLFDLLENVEFDTIYHEHLCYFSLNALTHLLRRHGLTIQRVEQIPIHGGTLRMWVTKQAGEGDASVAQLLEEERARGVAAWST